MNKMLLLSLFIVLMLSSCVYQASDFDEGTDVHVEIKSSYIQIDPLSADTTTCFIFYPGGLVDPEAYIESMQKIAGNGCRVIIIKATGDLAIFNIKRASKIVEDFPGVKHWIVGGHSLGGVVAVKAVALDSSLYDGLVLMAAYPAEKDDLSDWDGAVLSLSATNDGFTLPSDIEAGKPRLPDENTIDDLTDFPMKASAGTTIYYEIEGGNHSQFGNYGLQKKDGKATITRDEQQELVRECFGYFFQANQW